MGTVQTVWVKPAANGVRHLYGVLFISEEKYMAKNSTNKIVWLVIVGLALSWVISGLAAGFTSNLLLGIAMFSIIFSGVFGKKPMETVSSIVPIAAIAYMIASSSLGDWWQWLVGVLIALFVGNALSNFRPDHEKEYASYKHELKHNFVSKKDGFSVSFPKKPQVIDTGDYSRQYVSGSKDAKHSVTVYDLADSKTTKAEIMIELRNAISRVANYLDIDEPNYEMFEIDGLPFMHTSFVRDNNSIYYYAVVVKDDKLYDIVLSIISEDDELFIDFVNSFKFTKNEQ